MKRHLSHFRSQLTYANTVATLALLVAMSTGGAYAASQLSKNSVGAQQIRTGAVGSRALKNHSIAVKDLSTRARTDRASVSRDGRLRTGTAVGASRDTSVNGYKVTFKHPVTRCTFAATLGQRAPEDPPAGSATISGVGGKQVTVATYDAAGTPVLAGFDLIAAC